MVFPEMDFNRYILDRESGDHATSESFQESLLDRRHEVAWNDATDNRVDPQEVGFRVIVMSLHRRESILRRE